MIDDQGNSWEPGVFPRRSHKAIRGADGVLRLVDQEGNVIIPPDPLTAPDDGPYSVGFRGDVVRAQDGTVVRDRGSYGTQRCGRCSGVFSPHRDIGTPLCPYCGSNDTIPTVASAGVSLEQVYRAVDAMDSGQFMDICIAREVFVMEVFESREEFEARYPRYTGAHRQLEYSAGYPVCVGIATPDGWPVHPHPLRLYSTSEEDAWRVVSMMMAYTDKFSLSREGRLYKSSFIDVADGVHFVFPLAGEFSNANLPEAICKAALYAIRSGLVRPQNEPAIPATPENEKFGIRGAI